MKLTSRKPRPINRSSANRDARLFVIATEGELTEPQYFRLFRSTRIQVELLNTIDGGSSPEKILARLSEFKKKYQLNDDDRLFLVLDVDRWPTQALASVAQSCVSQNFVLVVSNPCFEVWLALHFIKATEIKHTSKEIHKQLQENLGGYNKKIRNSWFNNKNVNSACIEARKLEGNTKDRWPQSVGTRVYLIIEELISGIKI